MTVYAYVDGPWARCCWSAARAGGRAVLRSLSLPGQKGAVVVEDGWTRAPGAFEEVAGQLREYFAGERERFEVPVDGDAGTEFQRRVWRVLEDVPYGTTVSYGEVARRVGSAGAGVRAVGTAIGRNPLLVVRPCHRVIGADGALRGYAAGVGRKERLLGLEGSWCE